MTKTPYQKAKAVERLFARLDQDIQKFSSQHSMKCISACGKCCTKPNIQATILEFLPLAMDYYLKGEAEIMLGKLRENNPYCHVFSLTSMENHSGFCGAYRFRGLTCRLFGASAIKKREEKVEIYTCNLIKTHQPEAYEKAIALVNQRNAAPFVSDYYYRLLAIDASLCEKYYSINEATLKALEWIMSYYAYRRPPRSFRKTA